MNSEIKESTMMNSQNTTIKPQTASIMRTFLKINEEQKEETPRLDDSQNSKKTLQRAIDTESETSFAEDMFKNLKDPTSESETEKSDDSKNNPENYQKMKRTSEQLKTFFCFDHI
mmetsp:Transcript_14911/g.13109  ORF Transcript_14911/g.13109 Transcript_14911/m.13109 type:complete len:115 (+) Transcript_14911:213-557(+)